MNGLKDIESVWIQQLQHIYPVSPSIMKQLFLTLGLEEDHCGKLTCKVLHNPASLTE